MKGLGSKRNALIFLCQVSDVVMKLTSHLASQPKSDYERRDLSGLRDEHSAIKVPSSDPDLSTYDITVVLDPASDKAQELIPIAMVGVHLFYVVR